jgi:hypothetical protein
VPSRAGISWTKREPRSHHRAEDTSAPCSRSTARGTPQVRANHQMHATAFEVQDALCACVLHP